MITIFIITDNIRHWAEDKGYPNECIRHTREKTTVCIGDVQIIIVNKLPLTLRGYKIDKWIIDKPITRRELQEIEWSFNPARVIETKKFEFINPHHTRLEWDGYDDRGWYCTSCDKDFGHDKPDYEFCPYCGAEWE